MPALEATITVEALQARAKSGGLTLDDSASIAILRDLTNGDPKVRQAAVRNGMALGLLVPKSAQGTYVVASLDAVAEFFGVSSDTIKKEWRKRGMPGQPKAWDLAAICKWTRNRERDPGGDPVDDPTRRKKLDADARLKELEVAKREREEHRAAGDLLLREAVEAEVSQAFISVKLELGKVPRLMMPRFPTAQRDELTDELRNQIDRALSRLSTSLAAGRMQAKRKGKQ